MLYYKIISIKANKDKLNNVKVKIPLESFIALVAILKNEKNASLIKVNYLYYYCYKLLLLLLNNDILIIYF